MEGKGKVREIPAEPQAGKVSNNFSGGINVNRKRVAAYCRVSTEYDGQTSSFELQQSYFERYIQENPHWELVEVYGDKGISGVLSNRPDFQRMLNDALAGKIDLILCKSLSRFSRKHTDLVKTITLLKEHDVYVRFEEENIDTSKSGVSELILSVLGYVAQMEVENLSEHQKEAFRMKAKSGILCGNPKCFGYDYERNNDAGKKELVINPEEAKIVQYIFGRYISGVGSSLIAKELTQMKYKTPKGLEVWNDSTVLDIIKNEKYYGDVIQGKTYTVSPINKRRLKNKGESSKWINENHHQGIISKEEFEKAQSILKKRSYNKLQPGQKREKYSRKYALSSMCHCGFCNGMLSRRSHNANTPYQKSVWQCSTATKKGKSLCQHSKAIPERIIENAFVMAFNYIAGSSADVTDELMKRIAQSFNIDKNRKKQEKIANKIKSIEKDEKKLLDAWMAEKVTEKLYDEKRNELKKNKELLQAEYDSILEALEGFSNMESRLQSIRNSIDSKLILIRS